MPGANLIPTIVGCMGNAEWDSEHMGTGDQYRLSLNTPPSAGTERGDWCSDPGKLWAVPEWQECCHSTGIRQARADFPHQEWFLRNSLKATFFSASLGIKYHRAVSFPCWMRVTQSMIAFSEPGSYFCPGLAPLKVFGGWSFSRPCNGKLSFLFYVC